MNEVMINAFMDELAKLKEAGLLNTVAGHLSGIGGAAHAAGSTAMKGSVPRAPMLRMMYNMGRSQPTKLHTAIGGGMVGAGALGGAMGAKALLSSPQRPAANTGG
jgi:hypothetical protein